MYFQVKPFIMDGDTEMSLPADPIEEQVQDWLLNTKGGQAYGRHFEYWSTEIVSESHLDTIRILQGFLSVVGLNKDPKTNPGLEIPPDVANAIYGPRFQKVLSDDNVLVKLLISCNAVNFILNSYTNGQCCLTRNICALTSMFSGGAPSYDNNK